jgi:hypothetical protein
MTALQTALDGGPLKDHDLVHSPLKDETVSFSAKIKALRKSDSPELEIKDAFPFLFDGREMEKGQRLKAYSADLLTTGDIVAVETNISSYAIPAKGDSTGRARYTLSLRAVFSLGDDS